MPVDFLSTQYQPWSSDAGVNFNDCNWEAKEEAPPLWETEPAAWDYDVAKSVAEKLMLLDQNATLLDQNAGQIGQESLTEDQSSGDGGAPNPRFKTEFCRNFREKGSCLYGDLCQFAHGRAELRQQDVVRHSKYKTKLCQKFWIAGYCAYGPRCNFIHQEEDASEETYRGFRPFTGPKFSGRKTSESSGDSGIETFPTPIGTNPPSSTQQGSIWQNEKDYSFEYNGNSWTRNVEPTSSWARIKNMGTSWANAKEFEFPTVGGNGKEAVNSSCPWESKDANKDANNSWLEEGSSSGSSGGGGSWGNLKQLSSSSSAWTEYRSSSSGSSSRKSSYGSELLLTAGSRGGVEKEIPHPEYNPIQPWEHCLANFNVNRPETMKWRELAH